ncbi:hypothetical protein OHA37_00425 [Streptomyces sp. NBC_00335]|uniref:hypothetical protein n=1 Tax=unclassified Streptomyces TaxID=2593676 RepID=UPI00224DE77E|nr:MULTISPECIES: hypothetical protein [unclassified Streptomyces]MCX5410233.1 hypothetical protein [Streptomyces sp. NBC_00086]
MISAGLALLATLQILLAAAAWRTGPAGRLTGLLGCALAYDSAVVAAGSLLGEGRLLEALSAGRFVVHALGTPLVVPCAALALRAGRNALGAAWAAAGALAVLGTVTTLPGLHLLPRHWADTLRYADAEPGGFPVAAVLAIVLLLLIGAAAWIRGGTPAIALGAFAVFAASAAAFAAPPLGNLGEAMMLAGLLAAVRRDQARPALHA